MKYDYRDAVKNDVITAICEYLNMDYGRPELTAYVKEHRDELEDELHDRLWCDDSVTGNASGSYTCNTYTAEEYLCHNFDLLEEAAHEFDEEPIITTDYSRGVEFWDVTIRCYLLPEAITEALDDIEQKGGD